MPVYNCDKFIGEAVESILTQSFRDFELIIIDDCSTDSTQEVISTFADQRIVFIKKIKNSGYISSLNMALQIAKGEFIARMDGDDISHSGRLEEQVNFLITNPDIVLCGTRYQLLSTNEVVANPIEDEDIKIALLDYCALGHPTVMFRKSFLTANNLSYHEAYYPAEDYDLWTRISALGKIANLTAPLLFYRSHENQVSIKEQHKQLKNSFRCRTRMLCYPLGSPTDADIKISDEIVNDNRVENIIKLKEVVDWMDKLFEANKRSGFYDQLKFKKYVTDKQRELIRSYYLHSTRYRPSVLYHFYKQGGKYRNCFTTKEHMKFILKCTLLWK